jgi:antitoxin ParD1/3/4
MPKVETISITLPPEMANWIREAVARGEYASASAVILDALREWEREGKLPSARVLASVKRGLRESVEGKSAYRGSFAKYAKE